MAQKSKAPARKPSKSKSSVVAKKAKTVSKPAPAKKSVGVVKEKVVAKAAKAVKATKIETSAPAKKAATKETAKLSASKEIVEAKAALKKESVASASTKTPKAKSRRISIDASPNEALSALAQKWAHLYKKAEQIEAKPYNMRAVFEEKTAITHKVLGWGYILANRNDRLEVLFKDGIKYLISNYKP